MYGSGASILHRKENKFSVTTKKGNSKNKIPYKSKAVSSCCKGLENRCSCLAEQQQGQTTQTMKDAGVWDETEVNLLEIYRRSPEKSVNFYQTTRRHAS